VTGTDSRPARSRPARSRPARPDRPGADTDTLAELEEERAFLLRSLADLEAEHDAGDLDDADYQALKDGYTTRAASVLRALDAGRAPGTLAPPRRWSRTLAVSAAVVALAVGLGFLVAASPATASRGRPPPVASRRA